jgi:hypothetical protein
LPTNSQKYPTYFDFPPTRNIACPHAMYSLILEHLKRLLYLFGEVVGVMKFDVNE